MRCLKQQLGAEIHFITKKNFANILQANPYIDRIWTIKKNINEISTALKNEKFDHLIDLHHNLRSLRLKLQLGIPASSFPKLNVEKWLLTQFKINRLPDRHIVDRYFETVQQLGVINDQQGLDFFILKNEQIDCQAHQLLPHQFITFAIGAKYATKRLPTHKIIQICQQIKQPIVLLGGTTDQAEAAHIEQHTGTHVQNFCGKLSLTQSASLIQQSRLLITHDTGLMHIGAALNKKIICIWGNTVTDFGMYPYQTQHINIANSQLRCRPCSKIGYASCPKKHFDCMEKINVNEVLRAIAQMSSD